MSPLDRHNDDCAGVHTLIDLPDQTCETCGLEHPGADCQQPDLFGGES